MKIALITDSASDLPSDIAAARKITIISHHVIWGTETFRDRVDITSQMFYERLVRDPVMPKTSQPSVGEFAEQFKAARAFAQADAVLCITVSARLSGTFGAAQAARELVDFPVQVVDSRAATAAQALIVLAAAEACDRGSTLDEAARAVQDASQRAQLLFTVNTLEFLHRGGRIGGAQRLFGTALNIRPILGLKDGAVTAVETVRTRKKTIDRLLALACLQADKRPLWVGIIHSNPPELEPFQREIRTLLNPDMLFVTEVSPAVGVYGGPEALGLGILPGKTQP